MKLPKLFSILIVSILVTRGLASCSKPAMVVHDKALLERKEAGNELSVSESFHDKIQRLKRIKGVEVHGTIHIKGRGKNVDGTFVMFVDGDNMDMVIHSKGVVAGSIDLKGNIVISNPSLHDEYLEYMFAVILRDSVTWWNIYEYDLELLPGYYLLRNSWKKIYISPVTMVPEKQVVQLMKQREVLILYDDVRDFGFGMMPSTVQFGYDDLECRLSLRRLAVHDVLRQSRGQGPLQQS